MARGPSLRSSSEDCKRPSRYISIDHSTGETLLIHAVDHGDVDFVTTVLHYGAIPTTAGREGRTPLLEASTGGSYDMVKLLVIRGANPNQKANVSPLELARTLGREDMAKLLKTHGAIN